MPPPPLIPPLPAPPLSQQELAQLCDFLYRRTGLAYGEPKRYYIERRVAERLLHSGVPGFAAYMARLRSSPEEAEALVNSLTVNETYFYREAHQLRCLSGEMLPEIAARRRPGDRIRLWSMPCATGEEAYSLALWLLENWPVVDAYHVEIVGSDIDTRALAAAVAGEYGARALSRLPPGLVPRYFERLPDGRHRIIQDLRESVRFSPANLVDRASMAAEGGFDVIFCRNALIYFDAASRHRAMENLYAALLPGGFLCLGHSETTAPLPGRLRPRRFAEAVAYQRTEAA